MVTNLGEEMHVAVFAIRDHLDEAGANRLHQMVIQRVGMTPVLSPAVWRYPIMDNIGGVGETMVQPFVFAQPLAESISVAITDSWREHEGFFLILCSCRPFNATSLRRWLVRKGWKVVDMGFSQVLLKSPPQSWWRRWWAGI